jgi:hypothetical protein
MKAPRGRFGAADFDLFGNEQLFFVGVGITSVAVAPRSTHFAPLIACVNRGLHRAFRRAGVSRQSPL